MTLALAIAIPLLAVYGLFLVWYGGRGQPLSPAEIDQFMKELGAHTTDEAVLQELQTLIAGDDGKEFVMQNLVRYRPKALYPPGYDYGDDPRAADRRYGKAVIGPLLRNGSLILFIASIARVQDHPGQMPWGIPIALLALALGIVSLFGYFTLQVPAGVTLYWVTSNLLQMLQQWAVPRFFMHPSTPAVAGASAGSNGREPVTIDGKAEKADKAVSTPAKSTAVAKPAPATKQAKGKSKGK